MATPATNPISEATFEYIRRMLFDQSGIALGPDKHYLVQLRLGPLAKTAGYATVNEYASVLQRSSKTPQHTAVIEAMTTNETSFFRDVSPFDALRTTLLPDFIKRRGEQGRIRIWCGASSTGQEPYSIAMIIRDHFPQLMKGRIEIVASDLANTVLTLARAGRYSQLEVNRGLPAPLLVKYFKQEGIEWVLSPDIKRMVDFRQLNLIDPWPSMQPFDFVFLRNVMIYFNVDAKREILRKMRGVLKPDGCLFLGTAETTMGVDETFQRRAVGRAVCYQPPGAPPLSAAASTALPAARTFPARAA
jgi:chemotaxis protein methyltransferase CheR